MRIALVGSAPSSVRLAPYRDGTFKDFLQARPVVEQQHFPFSGEQWEIWGCSPGVFGIAERVTRWFELHRWEPGQPWFSPEYCQWLRAFNGLLYTTEVVPELPASVRLPREAIVQEFGIYFLTSSLSFMMGMAIMAIMDVRTKPDHNPADDAIGLWGVDMSATEEYGFQRAGCQYFIQEAARRGIRVLTPPESDLLQPMPMYGICEWSDAHIKGTQRMRELTTRLQDAQQRLSMAQQEVQFLSGAIDDAKYMLNTWVLNEGSTLTGPSPDGQQLRYLDLKRFAMPA